MTGPTRLRVALAVLLIVIGGTALAPTSAQAAADAPSAANGPTPTVVQAPVPAGLDPVNVDMYDVGCGAPGDCVAIGRLVTAPGYRDQLLAEHLSNGSWVAVQPSLPADAQPDENASLTSITCSSAHFCVAVGRYREDYPRGARPLIETWNGATWTPTAPAVPANAGAAGFATLSRVSCASATSCAVVGSYETRNGKALPLVGTFTGAGWTLGRGALPGKGTTGNLSGVSCPQVDRCVAVGASTSRDRTTTVPLVETLAAGSWRASTPTVPADADGTSAYLSDVDCTGATSCAASGAYQVAGTNPIHTAGLVEVLDGAGWEARAVGAPTTTPADVVHTQGVDCWRGTDCLVAGNYYDENENGDPGRAGSVLSTITGADHTVDPVRTDRSTSGAAYADLDCTRAGSCLAVGNVFDAPSPPPLGEGIVAAVRDGSARSVTVPVPPGAQQVLLAGVALDTATTGVAIGDFYGNDFGAHGLLITDVPVR